MKSAQTLRDQEQRFHSLFDTIVDGIIVIDAQGRIQTLNPAAVTLFGYAPDEVQGKNIKMLMPEPYAREHDGYLHNYLTTGVKKVIGIGREVTGKRKDGSTFPMELAVSEMEVNGERMFTGIVRDITERKRAEDELQAVTALRQAMLDSANFSIISTDTAGMIQSFNRGAERMLGYPAEEMVGQCTPAIIHDLDEIIKRAKELSNELGEVVEPGFEAFVAKARKGMPDEREWTYVRKDGTRFPVLLSITTVRGAEGNIRGFLGIGSDITERRKVERMKSEFISTVSHELRTPLTSIRGALSLVMGKAAQQLPEKARRMLELAERNSERLTLLINDILDLEKIEAGRLEFNFKIVDLATLAGRALEDNEGYATEHQVQLVLDRQVTHAPVRADEHRLLQVFSNLISNAVKYSPRGGRVEISVVVHGDGFRAAVRDHGAGIPEEFRSRIFQRFAQADSSNTRAKGGTGLGLSITKAIVEHHEGRIGYESETGVGTIFHFELPAWHVLQEATDQATTSARVLICEDNPDVAQILVNMVTPEGVICDTAATAAGARSLLAKHAYRLMLLDLTLPDADGLTFLHELRGDSATAQLPVIVISGRAHEGRVAFSGDAVTVVDWIQKPVERERLERALKEALRRTKRPHILHVEDDPDIVQIVRVLLEGMIDLTCVDSLRGARQQLADKIFDLVILDLGLADGSGVELLDELKGHCPIVIFSAQAPDRAITEQVTVALTKSKTSNKQLLGTIKEILQLKAAVP
ncbi:MAG: PAS domain S-box protein [Gammaproteobacteria bacterium]|nr:PAS domain S-box protein [Gammaproteobacteria bacterium]